MAVRVQRRCIGASREANFPRARAVCVTEADRFHPRFAIRSQVLFGISSWGDAMPDLQVTHRSDCKWLYQTTTSGWIDIQLSYDRAQIHLQRMQTESQQAHIPIMECRFGDAVTSAFARVSIRVHPQSVFGSLGAAAAQLPRRGPRPVLRLQEGAARITHGGIPKSCSRLTLQPPLTVTR